MTSRAQELAEEYGEGWYIGPDGQKKTYGPNPTKIKAHLDGFKAAIDEARKLIAYSNDEDRFVRLSDLDQLLVEPITDEELVKALEESK